MLLFDLIKLHTPDITPENTKLHLATHNGEENPIDVFLEGGFEAWQSWQSQQNFGRPYIVALIKRPGRGRWMFAGAYESRGCRRSRGPDSLWKYDTEAIAEVEPLVARLHVGFVRTGRASYLNADRWAHQLEVIGIHEQRLSVEGFVGYRSVNIPWRKLHMIVQQGVDSWRTALRAVSGVYVIRDAKAGKLYVGSATGEGGIWGRWCAYAENGHGTNKDLRAVIREHGLDYIKQHFHYALLETADSQASKDEVLARESHWKTVLGSREHGYNNN